MTKHSTVFFLWACLSLWTFAALAQSPTLESANPDLVCPGRDYSYTVKSPPGNGQGCTASWLVTNGTYSQPSGNTSGTANIRFADLPGGTASFRAELLNCTTISSNGTTPLKQVYIRSVTGLPLDPITMNGGTSGAIAFGDNAPVTFSVPILEVPRHQNDQRPTLYVEAYEWTIPPGWAWSDGNTTERTRIYAYNYPSLAYISSTPNTITVTPTPGTTTSDEVKVRAVDLGCAIGAQSGYVPTRSNYATKPITRPVPSFSIATSKPTTGGPVSLYCGDNSIYNLSAIFGALPAGGSFGSFTWSGSGPITVTTSKYGPRFFVSGTGAGNIIGSTTYSRNGASTIVTATIIVTVTPELAPVVFTSTPFICKGPSKRFFIQNIHGATQYTWTVPAPLTTTQNVTLWPWVDITFPDNEPEGLVYTIGVTASSPSCGSSTGELPVQAGYGSSTVVAGSANIIFYQGYNSACAYNLVQLNLSETRPIGESKNFEWTLPLNGGEFVDAFGNPDPTANKNNYAMIRLSNSAASLRYVVRYSDGCDNYHVADYYLRTVTSVNNNPCSSGPANPRIYPNPAAETIMLEGVEGTVTLYDAYGKMVYEQVVKSAYSTLDVRQIPDGLYHLMGRSASGRTIRKVVQIQH
jgi:hypothetical protein